MFVHLPRPTRWWRREHSVRLVLWPAWLAQALCPHARKTHFSEPPGYIWRCDDCFKFRVENDELRAAWEWALERDPDKEPR